MPKKYYTVAIREHKAAPYQYIAADLSVLPTAEQSKPLTKTQAEWARDRLVAGAAKIGRPIQAKVVLLPEYP